MPFQVVWPRALKTMKVLLVHNYYANAVDGEATLVHGGRRLLEERGHEVIPFFRCSDEINRMKFGRSRAFVNGVYNWSARKAVREIITLRTPDVAVVHNVFPLISPSVLSECRGRGVPVVMSVNNFRLICPNGLFLTKGHTCEKCAGGREYWCVVNNCEGSILKSVGYAVRNAVAARMRLFMGNVAVYAPMTEFQRNKLISEGFPANRTMVIPNAAWNKTATQHHVAGAYVLHVGRVSPEKGIPTLIAAARQLPRIPFKAAGERTPGWQFLANVPTNYQLLGYVSTPELTKAYMDCRIVVVCSVCYEGFPGVLLEAMSHAKPVICSRIGGLPEVVEDGVTGLLFEPGNTDELAEKIGYLWDRPQLCRRMGEAGRERVRREYSPERYYDRFMTACDKAMRLGPPQQDERGTV